MLKLPILLLRLKIKAAAEAVGYQDEGIPQSKHFIQFGRSMINKQKPAQWTAWETKTNREGYRGAVFDASQSQKTQGMYYGWYRDNQKHGKGFQSYVDSKGAKTFYEGDWERDTRHGHGSLSFDCEATKKTLRLYNGEWKYDQMSGSGMKSFSDGGLYKGDFKNGMRHGQGIMYYQDGSIYIGEWCRDVRHGIGRLVNKGNYYEGSFRNDTKCGLGRYYHLKTGQLQEGLWLDNLPQVTVIFDDPNNRIDESTGMNKTEFDIPPLTVLKNPRTVYLQRAHEVLNEIEEFHAGKHP